MTGAGNAEGGINGVTAAGPDNKYDGVGAHPEVDNCEGMADVRSGLRITQPWKTGEGATPSSQFALGNVPD